MSWHRVEKEFYDYADDIEGVNIHYAWTPLGGVPDWEVQRQTRFMPLVEADPAAGRAAARLRRKVLRLPRQILDPRTGRSTNQYLLHHYFELFQAGHRSNSAVYTEEVVTGAETRPIPEKEAAT